MDKGLAAAAIGGLAEDCLEWDGLSETASTMGAFERRGRGDKDAARGVLVDPSGVLVDPGGRRRDAAFTSIIASETLEPPWIANCGTAGRGCARTRECIRGEAGAGTAGPEQRPARGVPQAATAAAAADAAAAVAALAGLLHAVRLPVELMHSRGTPASRDTGAPP